MLGLKEGDDDTFLLYYTSVGAPACQSIAYSTDGGETVKYYNDGEFLLGVQDMKIIWHAESQKWLLIPTNGKIYYSSNLINWTEGGRTYQKNGTVFPGWECQDLYPLEVDGDLNGDGNVDICDFVKQNLYEKDKSVEVKNFCDYNKDKKIDGKDAASLRKLIIGTITNILYGI